jgi:Zn finger protein HypA/HybF involved in hydrogenase expression
MEQGTAANTIGYQRLVCKNPGCGYLFKEIYFSATWTATTARDSGVPLTETDGARYYLCPQCRAKNMVCRQGERIILEKIVHAERAVSYPRSALPGGQADEYGN